MNVNPLPLYALICITTVNPEIFVHKNTRVLNIRVDKFSWIPHKKFSTRKYLK